MAFTKEEMQSELSEFMQGYANSIDRLYGSSLIDLASNSTLVKKSPLWVAVNDMYDFGIIGNPVLGLTNNLVIDGIYADAEVFFNCIAHGEMETFMYEDNVTYPKMSINAIRVAVARVVLEGGERYTDYSAGEHGLGNGDWGHLTLSEIALLADMDERSVRNAANPKVNDPLKTESVGKRSLVTPLEAKRWLAGRKGFVPTKFQTIIENKVVNKEITLPSDLIDLLKTKCEKTGLSLVELITQVI
jgi:hypothetical protein